RVYGHGVWVDGEDVEAIARARREHFFQVGHGVTRQAAGEHFGVGVRVFDGFVGCLEHVGVGAGVGLRLPEEIAVGFVPHFPVVDFAAIAVNQGAHEPVVFAAVGRVEAERAGLPVVRRGGRGPVDGIGDYAQDVDIALL